MAMEDRLVKLACGKLGYHEVCYDQTWESNAADLPLKGNEVAQKVDSYLSNYLIQCNKQECHNNFIPINSFSMVHLPEGYRDPDIVKCIQAQATLTVKIWSNKTSKNRPPGYAFYNYRGTNCPRSGSGVMQYIYRNEKRQNTPCPCPECKTSGNPKLEWSRLKIRTATHTVFDNEEAQNSTVEFFYDTMDRKGVKCVHGEYVSFGAIPGDWRDIRCVTHDIDLSDKLKDAWGRWRYFEDKVNKKYGGSAHQLCALVSHPHGCSKQVSIGSWRDRDIVDMSRDWESSVYTYDVPTCPGSSGGPMWFLGKTKFAGFFGRHPHSGQIVDGYKVSAVGLDRKG